MKLKLSMRVIILRELIASVQKAIRQRTKKAGNNLFRKILCNPNLQC